MKYWKREMRKVKIRQEEEGASSKEGFVLGGEIIRQSQCLIIFWRHCTRQSAAEARPSLHTVYY